ncbi:MAG: carbohydrate kinase [Oscillospiraceae bacterium]|nr:carbohydrate kinase [Oscillospiraceae bacterium]
MITAIGEVLIDFTPAGRTAAGIPLFEQNPGGAPVNVLACAAKLGARTACIGMVGADAFGDYLDGCLTAAGVDTRGLARCSEAGTTLAFVHLDDRGDRSFSFYRNPGADQRLTPADVTWELVEQCRIFHFGSIALTQPPACGTVMQAAKRARALGKIISFDPNYRPPLWAEHDIACRRMQEGARLADIVKASGEELPLLTGETDPRKGAAALLEMGCALVFVTMGPEGAFFAGRNAEGFLPACEVNTIDTTGAGDGFLGAVLYRLQEKSRPELGALGQAELSDITRFANAVGSLVTTQKGGLPAMPAPEEVEKLMRERKTSE